MIRPDLLSCIIDWIDVHGILFGHEFLVFVLEFFNKKKPALYITRDLPGDALVLIS